MLTATSYLLLLLAPFLSTLSLPADIKNRTLHTVVTKPVRASEIVLGRILGFAAVGTCLLVFMGVTCYVFVERRACAHASIDGRRPPLGASAATGEPAGLQGFTSRANRHRHKVTIEPSGQGHVEMEQGHSA